MYKVMFLDDEPITLRMLESAIDWQKYEVEVCASATDGEEGIALFRQFEPDIVIADIRMPKMNGIEFARILRETRENVKILLLSAYAEFEYAQSAITYQISEYLLKPLDEDQLEAAIVRIVRELDQENRFNVTMERYRIEQVEKQLQQLFVQHPAREAGNNVTIPEGVRMAFGSADVLIDVLRVEAGHESQPQSYGEVVQQCFKDRLGAQTAAVSISPVDVIVLTTQHDIEGQFADIANAVCQRGESVRMGISQINGQLDLIAAFCQARAALNDGFYTGVLLSFYSPDAIFSSDLTTLNFADFETAVAELIEQGKPGALVERITGYLSEWFARRIDPTLLYDFVFDLLNWVKITAVRQYPTHPLTALAAIDRNQLRAYDSKEMLVDFLTDSLQDVGLAVNHLLSEDSGYYVIRQTKDYVKAHYTEAELSLQAVADYVGLSKNHFSRVFHEATGIKFWDYVTQLRIDKAKELLKKSNRSNYEICRAIGYESEFYFSKIFKRVVGITAQEFRRL